MWFSIDTDSTKPAVAEPVGTKSEEPVKRKQKNYLRKIQRKKIPETASRKRM
jgi:hypothetical protein